MPAVFNLTQLPTTPAVVSTMPAAGSATPAVVAQGAVLPGVLQLNSTSVLDTSVLDTSVSDTSVLDTSVLGTSVLGTSVLATLKNSQPAALLRSLPPCGCTMYRNGAEAESVPIEYCMSVEGSVRSHAPPPMHPSQATSEEMSLAHGAVVAHNRTKSLNRLPTLFVTRSTMFAIP